MLAVRELLQNPSLTSSHFPGSYHLQSASPLMIGTRMIAACVAIHALEGPNTVRKGRRSKRDPFTSGFLCTMWCLGRILRSRLIVRSESQAERHWSWSCISHAAWQLRAKHSSAMCVTSVYLLNPKRSPDCIASKDASGYWGNKSVASFVRICEKASRGSPADKVPCNNLSRPPLAVSVP